MVVDDLHFRRTITGPVKADPVPFIDPYTVLTFPIAGERFQAIPWGNSKLSQPLHRIKLVQLAASYCPEFTRAALSGRLCITAVEHIFRALVGEGPDHTGRIAWAPCYHNGSSSQ